MQGSYKNRQIKPSSRGKVDTRIKVELTKEQHSGWEVYVPARLSTTGKRERKRFNLKADATQYAAELNIKPLMSLHP